MEQTMYETLLQLPLFQGIGINDLTKILDKVRFHFTKYRAGQKIFAKGDNSKNFVFIISGTFTMQSDFYVDEAKISYCELMNAPYLLEPFSLYGLHQTYLFSYTARTNVCAIIIEKTYLYSELINYPTFRINFINMLSNGNQRMYDKWGKIPHGNVRNKLIDFLLLVATVPTGEKFVKAKMEDLAYVLNTTRLKLSKVLNELKEENVIDLLRMGFRVPALEALKREPDPDAHTKKGQEFSDIDGIVGL